MAMLGPQRPEASILWCLHAALMQVAQISTAKSRRDRGRPSRTVQPANVRLLVWHQPDSGVLDKLCGAGRCSSLGLVSPVARWSGLLGCQGKVTAFRPANGVTDLLSSKTNDRCSRSQHSTSKSSNEQSKIHPRVNVT